MVRTQLANVRIDWGDLDVRETYPARIPELWAGRPVILFGRYRAGGKHEITVQGTIEGESAQWRLTANLPKSQSKHYVLAKVWARRKIEDVMHQSYYAGSPAVEEEVTAIAIDYGLMSQYTSFVAVDEKDADKLQAPAKPPRRMMVPVPLPEGAQWDGFFGEPAVDRFADVTLGMTLAKRINGQVPQNQSITATSGFLAGGGGGVYQGRSLALGGIARSTGSVPGQWGLSQQQPATSFGRGARRYSATPVPSPVAAAPSPTRFSVANEIELVRQHVKSIERL